jgi:putative glycosyltransferase (TIGR04372 family)
MLMPDHIKSNLLRLNGLLKSWFKLNPGKKLFKLFLLPMYILFGFFEFLLFLLTSPFVMIRIGRISSGRIGHFLLEYDWYFSFLKLNTIPKTRPQIDLFFYEGNISNTYLDQLWRRKAHILPRFLVFPLYAILRISPALSRFLVPLPLRPTDFSVIDNLPSQIQMSNLEIQKGIEALNSVGIKENSKLVCLYVRDSAYAESLGLEVDFASYRDSEIENYLPLIEELLKLGYFVARMGKVTGKVISVQSPMFLDYANSKIRSDFLDFYISSVSMLAICTDSGMMQFPIAFRKPLGLVNVPAFHGLLKGKCLTLFQFKTFLDSSTGVELNLIELLSRGFEEVDDLRGFLDIGITHQENSPEELLNFGLELLKFVESPAVNNAAYRAIAEEFKSIARSGFLETQVPRLSISWVKNHSNFLKDF